MTRNEARGVDLLASLEKRRDFLRCARGKKAVRRSFVLQMAARPAREGAMVAETSRGSTTAVRVGFTASRKVGSAVQRNRAKRRLRAAARAIMPDRVVPGFDYVLIARSAVLTCPYADLEADLRSALAELAKAWARVAARAAASPAAISPAPGSLSSTAR